MIRMTLDSIAKVTTKPLHGNTKRVLRRRRRMIGPMRWVN